MMRVAMLSYHTCPLATLGGKDTGGMNVYVRDLTRELGRMGVHVDVFTRSQDEHVPHVLHDLGYGNRVVHVPAGPEQPLPKQQLAEYIPQFVDGIKTFASEKNIHYDIIHSHYWMSGVAARQLKKDWGVPVAHMFHTLGEMKNRIARTPEEKEGIYRLSGERQVLKSVDRIIAATPAEQAQLIWLYKANPEKISIIPPGVDLEHFYPIPKDEAREYIGISADERMILFVGRIERLKGVDTLIRAVSTLHLNGNSLGHPVYLSIIGGDPSASLQDMDTEMARLQTLSSDLCMDRMVLFLGKRGQDTLPYYYSAADILVMPSHYESFGMVALEAMACGTPVVASQVGGLAFLVQDGVNGYSVPDQDPEVLADRLAKLLNQPTLRMQMGQQAAEFARGYSWQNISRQIVGLYEELLAGYSGTAATGRVM
jgi:D-inositol-3-phosphate glycosyltransferase